MIQLYTTLLYQPLLNLLVFFYAALPVHDLGLAIILVTVVTKLLLFPLAQVSLRSQRALQRIQPKLEALKQQHKNDKAKLTAATMELYKQEKVNPFSSCLPLLIQLPFLIAVYQVFQKGIASQDMNLLYPFIQNPGTLNTVAFGFLNLGAANIPIAILAALAQFWQTKMMVTTKPPVATSAAKDEAMLSTMNKQMMYMMPLMTVFLGVTLPGGLMLYWLFTTVLAIAQQWYFLREGTTAGNLVIPQPPQKVM